MTDPGPAVEDAFPGVAVDQTGRVAQRLGQRPVQLRGAGGHDRATGLGDEFVAQVVVFGFESGLELVEAPSAQGPIGGPVGFVEGSARGGDRAVHVLGSGRRGGAEHPACGGVEVVVDGAGDGIDQGAVDEHPAFGAFGHPRMPLRLWCDPRPDFAHVPPVRHPG